jgi:hypothetical protein
LAERRASEISGRNIFEDARNELEVAICLAGAFETDLRFSRAVGVIERPLRGATLSNRPKIPNCVGLIKATLFSAKGGEAKLKERRELRRARELTLDVLTHK